MAEVDTLSGIAEWAAYNAHGSIFHGKIHVRTCSSSTIILHVFFLSIAVIGMINQYGVDGIETQSSLYQRSKFFFLVEMLDHLNYLDCQSFSDVVTLLDELVCPFTFESYSIAIVY